MVWLYIRHRVYSGDGGVDSGGGIKEIENGTKEEGGDGAGEREGEGEGGSVGKTNRTSDGRDSYTSL